MRSRLSRFRSILELDADYLAAVLADSPSILWRGSEAPAALVDSSPNGIGATASPDNTAHSLGGDLHAQGDGSVVHILDDSFYESAALGALGQTVTQASLELWVSIDHAAAGPDWQLLFGVDALTPSGLGIKFDPSGVIVCQLNEGDFATGFEASYFDVIEFGDDSVFHLVMTADTTREIVRLFVNGKLHAQEDAFAVSITDFTNLRLAHQAGSFADAAFYRSALSIQQIEHHYLLGIGA